MQKSLNIRMNQTQSNRGRGGKRPGAGRKKGSIEKITLAKRATQTIAEQTLDRFHEITGNDIASVWITLLISKDEAIRLRAAAYLTDRIEGKAVERVAIAGQIQHVMSEADRKAADQAIEKLLGPAQEPAIDVEATEVVN
jgi:hypothetical protein